MKKISPLRLHHEIVHDILLCLPAKSLQRFKLLSKPLGSLISDPNFAESHLRRANNSQDNDSLLRVGRFKMSTRGTGKFLSLYSMDSNGSNREVVTLDYAVEDYFKDAHIKILGSCNGLLLVAVDIGQTCFIWNPSTGKYKRIPPRRIMDDMDDGLFISALGYESTSENYKGIIVSHYISGLSSPHTSRTGNYESLFYDVYDYKRNSWARSYDGFPYGLCSNSLGVMVNGVPHWCVYHQELDRTDGEDHYDRSYHFRVTYLMVSFNWENENFTELELPAWTSEEMEFTVTSFRGCLSILQVDPHGSSSSMGIWAMKEYGVPASWTKLFAIPYTFETLRPICFARKKEVLLELGGRRLIIFNLEENTTKEVLLTYEPCQCKVFTYMGSLVFPEEHGEEANDEESGLFHLGGDRVLSEGFDDEIDGS